jgi:hypothetical protein
MRSFRILSTLLLGGALITPVAVMAFQQGEERSTTTTTTTTTESKRYYDPVYKEYHQWSPTEDRAYHMYIDETHKTYEDFPKVTTTQQTEYWKWRHDHPDKVIFKTETEERK